jgi:hypothetical protein
VLGVTSEKTRPLLEKTGGVKKKQITLALCNSVIYFSSNRAVPLWERLLCRP